MFFTHFLNPQTTQRQEFPSYKCRNTCLGRLNNEWGNRASKHAALKPNASAITAVLVKPTGVTRTTVNREHDWVVPSPSYFTAVARTPATRTEHSFSCVLCVCVHMHTYVSIHSCVWPWAPVCQALKRRSEDSLSCWLVLTFQVSGGRVYSMFCCSPTSQPSSIRHPPVSSSRIAVGNAETTELWTTSSLMPESPFNILT